MHSAPLGKSHHQILTFEFGCYTRDSGTGKGERLIYAKGDSKGMRERLAARGLTEGLAQLGVQEAWDYLADEVRSLTEDFIPTTKGGKTGKRKPLWFNEKALLKVKLKRAAFQRYLQTREGKDYVLYTHACNQAKSACRRALKDFEKQEARSAKLNPKAFFAVIHANSKLRTKESC